MSGSIIYLSTFFFSMGMTQTIIRDKVFFLMWHNLGILLKLLLERKLEEG